MGNNFKPYQHYLIFKLMTMKKMLLLVGTLLSTTFLYQCTCDEAQTWVDLLLPEVIWILDEFGNPLINPNTGQQYQDVNELYRNRRTNEVFSHLHPPRGGVRIGDVLDVGTRVFNKVCRTSAPSYTEPTMWVSDYQSQQSFTGTAAYTPEVQGNNGNWGQQNHAYCYATFQVNKPAFYQFDWNANHDQRVEENDYGNNWYFGGDGGARAKSAKLGGFEVVVGPGDKGKRLAPSTLGEPILQTEYFTQYADGTTAASYQQSSMAQFMRDPNNLMKFYQFKEAHPDQPFLLHEHGF